MGDEYTPPYEETEFNDRGPAEFHSKEFLRGSIAAFANVVLTFPLNKIIARQAYEGLSMVKALSTVKNDGLRNLYRGLAPPMLQRMLSMGIMWSSYDYWYQYCLSVFRPGLVHSSAEGHRSDSPVEVRFFAGVLSGSTEALLAPFERIQTVLQHRHYLTQYRNTLDVVKKLKPYGIKEYYRGFSALLLRNSLSNALWFTLRNPIKDAFPENYPWPSPPGAPISFYQRLWSFTHDFLCGAVLGATISTIFFPINVFKSVMQLDIGGPHKSIWKTASEIYKERGFRGTFHGVYGNALRSLLSWGIVNSTYELVSGNDSKGSQGE